MVRKTINPNQAPNELTKYAIAMKISMNVGTIWNRIKLSRPLIESVPRSMTRRTSPVFLLKCQRKLRLWRCRNRSNYKQVETKIRKGFRLETLSYNDIYSFPPSLLGLYTVELWSKRKNANYSTIPCCQYHLLEGTWLIQISAHNHIEIGSVPRTYYQLNKDMYSVKPGLNDRFTLRIFDDTNQFFSNILA